MTNINADNKRFYTGESLGFFWEAETNTLPEYYNKGLLNSRIVKLSVYKEESKAGDPVFYYELASDGVISSGSVSYIVKSEIVKKCTSLYSEELSAQFSKVVTPEKVKPLYKEEREYRNLPIPFNMEPRELRIVNKKCDWCNKGPLNLENMIRVTEIFGPESNSQRVEVCHYCSWFCMFARMDTLQTSKTTYMIQPIKYEDLNDFFYDMADYIEDKESTLEKVISNDEESLEVTPVSVCMHGFKEKDCPIFDCDYFDQAAYAELES